MAVALLTMINHSWHSFQEECIPKALQPDTYDAYTLLFVLVSALLMHMLDVLLDVLIQNWSACQCAREDPSEVVGPAEYEMENDPIRGPCGMKGCGSQSGEICEMTGCCQNRGNAGEKSLTGARRIVAALLMEFGLTLHSVFLGLSVGIGNDADTKSLLVALSFHQLFEGLALGSRLADASMHAGAELALALIFSFSVPVGTAIGLISVKGSNVSMTGPTFVTLQAVVNAIGGGILLYIGFGLLLNDFPADLQRCAGMRTSHRGWRIFAMFLAVWAGAGIMALLANLH
ncbi:putative cation transporter [Trypanosoma grayi]|uniref:putative cation transporter n=1 Tax=Trypanosoma grayi TaxID=71804 RepID=UPI0004F42DC7|nr:putative cation transporter [Trypanosoma grayi]KEG10261.1 putative cation transporter [Trypanosoma grayi]